MNQFKYKGSDLYVENVKIIEIIKRHGTPCFIYSKSSITEQFTSYKKSFKEHPHLICYAVKANSNLSILNHLVRLGSGFDIVSGGELKRVLAAGGDPKKVVFSGIGKSEAEISLALDMGIYCFNVESLDELDRIQKICGQKKVIANISLRVNPDVDAETHPYISTGLKENKFGIAWTDVIHTYKKASQLQNLSVIGIDCHIGSQITSTFPFIDSVKKILGLADDLEKLGIPIRHFDFGGGLGIRYEKEAPPSPKDWVRGLLSEVGMRKIKVILEPGRSIVGSSGVLVTKIEYLKKGETKNFLIVDAAMNDLLRPALYNSHHDIISIDKKGRSTETEYDVVGPICETADFLGKKRKLDVKNGDYLAILDAGAYAMSMSSNYNSRVRPPEIMVDNEVISLIKPREKLEELFQDEIIPW